MAIATYPLVGGRGEIKVRLPKKRKTCESRHQRLFEENVRKTKSKVCEYWRVGFRSCLHIGKVLAPHVPVTRDDNLLIECAKTCLQYYIVSLFIFVFFWGRQGCFPWSYIFSGAMSNSDLRSSLSLNVCVLNWFYVFERFILIANKKMFKALDLEIMF